MPELPEVETTIRYLRPFLESSIIVKLTATEKGKSHFDLEFEDVRNKLEGQRFKSLERYGKWMLFSFSNTNAVGHLRMSGRYLVDEKIVDHEHNRYQLHVKRSDTNDVKIINYIDLRRFGTFHLVDDFENHSGLNKLGPDALSMEYNAEQLHGVLQKTKRPIYTCLLDQRVVAGLGNIYVNETLHAAGIHPLTPGDQISLEQAEQIVSISKAILETALKFKGTTLIDNLYQDPEGNTGEFYKELKVYGQKKNPDIEVLKVGGRSVFVHKDTKPPK